MRNEVPSGRALHLLRMLYEQGESATTYIVRVKQSELAEQLNISRQALNVHLRKLRELGCVRTGRGFIDVTEEGLRALGVFVTPSFIFIKSSPLRREEAYEKMLESPAHRVFRVAGDMDAVLVVEREKLDETLRKLALVEGVQETKSYIAIQTLK